MPGRNTNVETTVTEERRRLRIRPAYVALAALMVLFAFVFIRKTQEVRRQQAQEAALQQQNRQTAGDNARLQRSIHYYGTPSYIESEARGVLGYTRPGEVPIVTRPTEQRVVVVRAAPAPPPPPSPVWKQWWNAFFG